MTYIEIDAFTFEGNLQLPMWTRQLPSGHTSAGQGENLAGRLQRQYF